MANHDNAKNLIIPGKKKNCPYFGFQLTREGLPVFVQCIEGACMFWVDDDCVRKGIWHKISI